MSLHAVRWKMSPVQADNPSRVPSPEPPSLPEVVPDRVQQNLTDKFSERLPGQAQETGRRNTEIDWSGTEYLSGMRRFDDADDLEAVLDAVEKDVVADAEWYVIEIHVCDHDEEDRSGCGGWIEERTSGSVPEEVK